MNAGLGRISPKYVGLRDPIGSGGFHGGFQHAAANGDSWAALRGTLLCSAGSCSGTLAWLPRVLPVWLWVSQPLRWFCTGGLRLPGSRKAGLCGTAGDLWRSGLERVGPGVSAQAGRASSIEPSLPPHLAAGMVSGTMITDGDFVFEDELEELKMA